MRGSILILLTVALSTAFNIGTRSQESIKVQIDFDTRSEHNVIVLDDASIVSVAIITTPQFNAHKVVDGILSIAAQFLLYILVQTAYGFHGILPRCLPLILLCLDLKIFQPFADPQCRSQAGRRA